MKIQAINNLNKLENKNQSDWEYFLKKDYETNNSRNQELKTI